VKFSITVVLLVGLSTGACAAQQSLPPGTTTPDAPAATAPTTPTIGKPKVVSHELAEIEDKIDEKQFDAARPPLLHYLETHSNDARAHFDLGFIDEQTDQTEAAETEYRKAIAGDPQQFESRLALGLLLARQDHMAEAREQLQAATERQPATPNPAAQAQAYRALAELDVSTDPSAAKQALLAALNISSQTPGDLLLTARIATANDDQETAEAAYRQFIAKEPDSVEGVAGLAHILVLQKKYAEAEPLLRSALAKIPDDPGLNMQMASLLAAEGKPEESVAELEKLHAHEPGNNQISQMLADAYLSAHHPEQAEPILASLLKSQPDDVDSLDEYGRTLIYGQKFAEASKVFEHATRLKGDDVDAWSGLAFADSRLHRDSEALKALSARSKLAQDTASTLFLWAISYDNLHQSKLAADYYQRFLDTAKGKFPDQEWQAHHRLITLGQAH
jgi:predicted Zn-dependent protease